MSLMTTLEEKRAYFNRVKLANFRESSRLEGYGPALPETAITPVSLVARLAGRLGPLDTSSYPDQGRSSLCGPAAFFYCLLRDRPDIYKLVVTELWETGETQIGNLEIEVGKDARRPTGFFYTEKDFTKFELPHVTYLLDTPKAPPIDWRSRSRQCWNYVSSSSNVSRLCITTRQYVTIPQSI